MILKIKKTGKIICKDLKIAVSPKDQLFGLLDPKNPRNMLFKTRFGIHTFFLKEPIDVLVLDNNLRIVSVKTEVKPNSLVFWNPMYSCVLELSQGSAKKFNLSQTLRLEIC